MKNVLRLSSILVFVFALLMLAGCTPSSLEKGRTKMEKADYVVVLSDKGDENTEGILVCTKITSNLTATLYKKASKAKEAAEKIPGAVVEGKWLLIGDEKAISAFTD